MFSVGTFPNKINPLLLMLQNLMSFHYAMENASNKIIQTIS